LHTIHLSGNQLRCLPAEIGQLTKLHWLDLSRNWLQELPPEIANLTELEWLGLADNDFKGVRDELFEREPRKIMAVLLARQQPSRN